MMLGRSSSDYIPHKCRGALLVEIGGLCARL
jgi:hypothetical protein